MVLRSDVFINKSQDKTKRNTDITSQANIYSTSESRTYGSGRGNIALMIGQDGRIARCDWLPWGMRVEPAGGGGGGLSW